MGGILLLMPQVLTNSPVELLTQRGIARDAAFELSNEFEVERIEQVIAHYDKLNEFRPRNSSWIVSCLRFDWLPFILFQGKTPPDRNSIERKTNLVLGRKLDYVQGVERRVGMLTRFEWEWLAGEVVKKEEDDCYKRQMFKNPTKSNWILCEKVDSLVRRDYLKRDEYKRYLEARLRPRTREA